jgi:DNA-binding NarL/FixJ family response regulator
MLGALGFEVLAAVDSGAGLLAAIDEHRPEATIVDVRLPPTFTDEGLLADGSGGVGYLLRDRVFDSAQFAEALRRVAAGGTAMDPEVISRLLARNSSDGEPRGLSPRERKVLELMAGGRSNAAIAQRMVITERAVAKHTSSIFTKLGLQPSDDDNRRVLAVLAYLGR